MTLIITRVFYTYKIIKTYPIYLKPDYQRKDLPKKVKWEKQENTQQKTLLLEYLKSLYQMTLILQTYKKTATRDIKKVSKLILNLNQK
jgi:hypothetical protein